MKEILFQNSLVYVTVQRNIGIIHINNGKQNRIIDPEFIKIDQLDELINNYDLKALVICGTGKNFSLGADEQQFKEYKNKLNEFKEKLNRGKKLLNYIENLPIITIALINGACFGAGFEIALSCQFRFSSERALFAFPEVNIGLMPGMGGNIRLTKMVGKAKALELILNGEIIGSEKAVELGIVNKIMPHKFELDKTISWINEITKDRSKEQISKIIDSINNATNVAIDTAYSLETDSFAELINISTNY